MAQCKKLLDNGERCSNRAVPGTDYCEQHRRIQFRKVSKAPSIPTPPPEKQKKKKTEKIVEVPQWVARPSAAGEESKFPGLRVDGRNILVAPQGLIWLSEQGSEEHPGTLFDRLVKLLACLSQDMPLPDHVSVWLMPEGAGALVRLTPSTSSGQASSHHEQVELSRHYDVAASAVALSEGLLYIGEERLFIRYRDGGAPRGYDAEDVKAPKGDDLYLIDLDGTHLLFPTSMIEEALADLLLRIAPLPLRGAELPEAAFVLVTPPLYRMLAHYFRDHHLRYRVARFFPTPSFAPPPNLPPQGGGTVPTPGPSHLSACGHAQAEEGNIHSPGPPQGGKSASPIPSSREGDRSSYVV